MANESENAPISEDTRVDSLEDRIATARKAEDARLAKEHPAAPVASNGLTVISTMVGYPLGGIIIGFGLDNLFDKDYVGSVIVNEANGRYYETGLGRNALLGLQFQF